ncbi:MAG TPA: Crp/Fnr family transcriptional regulator [Burkholderiales bacterium]|nr:Crp/Fnr family transcriptional regulator [Burkholderiales bacterium]
MHRRPEFARIRRTLANSLYFRSLADADLDALADLCHLRKLRDGALANGLGSRLDELWIVLGGGLRLSGVSAAGKEFLYAVLGPGSFYGLGNVIQGITSVTDARAHGGTELAVMSGARLLALLDRQPRLWRHVCTLLTHRLTLAMSVIRDMSIAPLCQRIAQRLLGQAMSGGADLGALGTVELRLTQADLGRMLGASRSKVNAELQQLEELGMLRLSYRSIRLLDVSRLQELAGPDVFAF